MLLRGTFSDGQFRGIAALAGLSDVPPGSDGGRGIVNWYPRSHKEWLQWAIALQREPGIEATAPSPDIMLLVEDSEKFLRDALHAHDWDAVARWYQYQISERLKRTNRAADYWDLATKDLSRYGADLYDEDLKAFYDKVQRNFYVHDLGWKVGFGLPKPSYQLIAEHGGKNPKGIDPSPKAPRWSLGWNREPSSNFISNIVDSIGKSAAPWTITSEDIKDIKQGTGIASFGTPLHGVTAGYSITRWASGGGDTLSPTVTAFENIKALASGEESLRDQFEQFRQVANDAWDEGKYPIMVWAGAAAGSAIGGAVGGSTTTGGAVAGGAGGAGGATGVILPGGIEIVTVAAPAISGAAVAGSVAGATTGIIAGIETVTVTGSAPPLVSGGTVGAGLAAGALVPIATAPAAIPTQNSVIETVTVEGQRPPTSVTVPPEIASLIGTTAIEIVNPGEPQIPEPELGEIDSNSLQDALLDRIKELGGSLIGQQLEQWLADRLGRQPTPTEVDAWEDWSTQHPTGELAPTEKLLRALPWIVLGIIAGFAAYKLRGKKKRKK